MSSPILPPQVSWVVKEDRGPNGAEGRGQFKPAFTVGLIVTLYKVCNCGSCITMHSLSGVHGLVCGPVILCSMEQHNTTLKCMFIHCKSDVMCTSNLSSLQNTGKFEGKEYKYYIQDVSEWIGSSGLN